MADIYVRPLSGGPYGAANGTSYDDAFAGFDNLSGVSDADTVWICGSHTKDLIISAGGSSVANTITYRGDYAADPGSISPAEGSVSVYFNGGGGAFGNVTLRDITITNTINNTATIYVAGAVGAVTNMTLQNIIINHSSAGRGIYLNGNGNTFTFKDITINHNPSTVGNTQAVYIWGNNATAGNGGIISNLTVNGLATFAYTNSNHVGLHIEDWNNLLIDSYTCDNMFSGIRLVDSDSNRVINPAITNCGTGLKSASNGGGFGVTVEISSASNIIEAGYFENNYQHYVDSTSSGGNNNIIGSLMITPIVNSISYTSTSSGVGGIYNNTIIHNPTDNEGHGIVVQNGDASTAAIIKNNIVVCGTTGLNIQCVAVGGTTGTNYDDIHFDYNCYYVTNGAMVGKTGITEYATLALWQAAIAGDANITGKDANSMQADPLLDSSYKLTASSPCVGTGTNWQGSASYDSYDQPIVVINVDIGNQSTHSPWHPVNL